MVLPLGSRLVPDGVGFEVTRLRGSVVAAAIVLVLGVNVNGRILLEAIKLGLRDRKDLGEDD